MQFPILASALRVSTRLAHGGLIVLAGSLLVALPGDALLRAEIARALRAMVRRDPS